MQQLLPLSFSRSTPSLTFLLAALPPPPTQAAAHKSAAQLATERAEALETELTRMCRERTQEVTRRKHTTLLHAHTGTRTLSPFQAPAIVSPHAPALLAFTCTQALKLEPSAPLHVHAGDDISRVSAHHKTAAQHASDRADALERALSATVRAQHRTRSRLDF